MDRKMSSANFAKRVMSRAWTSGARDQAWEKIFFFFNFLHLQFHFPDYRRVGTHTHTHTYMRKSSDASLCRSETFYRKCGSRMLIDVFLSLYLSCSILVEVTSRLHCCTHTTHTYIAVGKSNACMRTTVPASKNRSVIKPRAKLRNVYCQRRAARGSLQNVPSERE